MKRKTTSSRQRRLLDAASELLNGIRDVPSRYMLAELKRKLAGYDARTGQWKEKI